MGRGQLFFFKAVILVAVLFLLWQMRVLLMLFFGSILLGIIGYGGSKYIARKFNIKYEYGAIMFLFLVVGLVSIFLLLALPNVSDKSADLFTELPERLESVENSISEFTGVPVNISENIDGGNLFDFVKNYFPDVLNFVTGAFAMLVLALYLIVDYKTYRNIIYYFFPKKSAEPIIERVNHDVQIWFLGQLISMSIVGILVVIGLLIIGMEFAFVLGLFAGILEFIPTLGPIIAFIPIVLIALSQSGTMALYAATLYLIVQTIEGYFLTPMVQQRLVSVPAVIQLGIQLVFGILFGLVGIFFAVPFYVFARAIYRGLREQDLVKKVGYD